MLNSEAHIKCIFCCHHHRPSRSIKDWKYFSQYETTVLFYFFPEKKTSRTGATVNKFSPQRDSIIWSMFAYTEWRGKEVNIRRQWGDYCFRTYQTETKNFVFISIRKSGRKLISWCAIFSLGLHRVILANHFRTSQSARPKSTIHLYLCGKHV